MLPFENPRSIVLESLDREAMVCQFSDGGGCRR